MTQSLALKSVTTPPTSFDSSSQISRVNPHAHRMKNNKAASDLPATPEKRMPQVDRSQVNPALLKAAQQMEGHFLNYMMKVMRDSVESSDLSMENGATKIYRSMLDEKRAQKAANAGGIGLADLIIAYSEATRYNENRARAESYGSGNEADRKEMKIQPPPGTGGTHENR